MAITVTVKNQIPKKWQNVKLGDILTELPQYGYTASSTKSKLGPKLLRITDIQNDFVDWENVPYCEISEKEKSKYLLETDDIVFARTGNTTGANFYLNNMPREEAVFASYLIRVTPDKKKCLPKYLAYFFRSRSYWGQVKNLLSGSAQPGINASNLQNLTFDLPEDIETQKEIVSILSVFDDKIELNNKIAKTLEEMAQALFKEWFVSGDLQEWKTSKFENYARLEYGKALQEGKRISGEVLVFGSSGQIGTHNEKICSGPGIVVGRKGNVGSVFWVDEDFYPIDTTFYVKSEISLYYIYFTLKNMRFHTGDSAVPGLNRESVHSTEILIPDKNILDKFDEIASPMFKTLAEIEKENQKLAALRDLLWPKLMKGEIRV